MTMFQVWAPNVRRVEVKTGQRLTPMAPEEHGWWWAAVPDAGPGTDYAFVLDGGPPLPDPRSPYQPQGVHGPSRLVDQAAFDWTDAGWQPPPFKSALVYELHIGTFTQDGTFEAAITKLDDLVDLGVTHIELMPVVEFPGRHGWGYDGVDLYAPHHAYGGPDGLKRLVNACHARQIAVILDVVYNHLGPDGNYLSQFGPYFTDRYATPWGDAVNLDGPGSEEVRRFFIDNALMWLRDYHIDGLRLDAVHAIMDTSAVHFLEQLAVEVDALETQLGRRLVLIAESDLNDPRIVRAQEAGGYGLDAQWSDDFHHALHTVLTGEHAGYYLDFGSLSDLAAALQRVFVYAGRYSAFRRRRHGRPVVDVPAYRFLSYLQNHDQIGNRAKGDRISHLISADLVNVGAALVLTSPFVPMLFQGEEWAASSPFQYFTSHEDSELGRAVSQGRQKEFVAFGWNPEHVPDPQAPETFQHSRLDWEERERSPHAEILDWHRSLIGLRRQEPDLSAGGLDRVEVQYDEDALWLVLWRGRIAVCCNLAEGDQELPLPAAGLQLLLASKPGSEPQKGVLRLPAYSVAVLKSGAPDEQRGDRRRSGLQAI